MSHNLVGFEGADEVLERGSESEPVPLDDRGKGDEDRVPRRPLEAVVQFRSPPGQQLGGSISIAGFITEIIGPSAERVDGAHALVHPGRDESAQHTEVLTMGDSPGITAVGAGLLKDIEEQWPGPQRSRRSTTGVEAGLVMA